jgi:hypothetical protein
MSTTLRTFLAAGLALAGLGLAAESAGAQSQGGNGCVSPPGMNYMICNGQKVPKPGNRVVQPDGGWREETRQGNCVVIREKTANGDFREVRRCD